AAVTQAELELMMEQMPPPPRSIEEASRNPRYRYDGRALQLSYPQAEGIVVRIYDHAGKINLGEISPGLMRNLIEYRLGGPGVADNRQVEELMAAWNDWRDLNDGAAPGGAERDYYLGLEPPYVPRNGRLESVEEVLLIRGFAELFDGVDVDAAFTLYGDNALVNLNLATVEAM